MNGRNILAIILAIIVGIVAFRIIMWVFGLVVAIAGWLLAGAIIGGIAYLAYRKFNHMLSSGKRLT